MQYRSEELVIEVNGEEFLIRYPWDYDEIYISTIADAAALIRAAHKWMAVKLEVLVEENNVPLVVAKGIRDRLTSFQLDA